MLIDGYDFVERRVGVKRELCFEYFGKCSEYSVSYL